MDTYWAFATRGKVGGSVGVELSEYASSVARERLGLDIFTGTVEDFIVRENEKKFSLVYSTDVIEHVSGSSSVYY